MRIQIWGYAGVVLLLITVGCAARQAYPPPSRGDFIREVLLGVGTPTTADFWSRPGSYHADKLDLLEGFRLTRQELGDKVLGLAIVGPTGAVWQYSVVCFLQHRDKVRLNWLIFPHARIVSKGTLDISREEYADLRAAVSHNEGIQLGVPSEATVPRDPERDLDLDWRYDVLFADWSSGGERIWHSAADAPDEHLQPLYERLSALLERSTRTYGNYGGLSLSGILIDNEP